MVASAFESHHMGPFSLKVDCSFPFDLQEIPQEGAGMYTRFVLGAWCVFSQGSELGLSLYFTEDSFQGGAYSSWRTEF